MPSGTAAIIAAAGSGRRLGASVPKQWLSLGGTPVISHVLHFFESLDEVDQIALALDADTLNDKRRLAHLDTSSGKPTQFVPGGRSRQESVWNALQSLVPVPEIVLIHDAARPFPPKSSVLEAIEAARKHGGAILAVPVTDTIKRVGTDGCIAETLDRTSLWAAQTPQAFRFDELVEAYEKIGDNLEKFTDDASIFEAAGGRCVIVESVTPNFKITLPEDLERAERWLITSGGAL